MLDDRLAANVHNKCDARTNLRNVAEVLFRPDPNVCAAGNSQLLELLHDVQVSGLIRRKVVGGELAFLLRKFLSDAGEFPGGYGSGAVETLERPAVGKRNARDRDG